MLRGAASAVPLRSTPALRCTHQYQNPCHNATECSSFAMACRLVLAPAACLLALALLVLPLAAVAQNDIVGPQCTWLNDGGPNACTLSPGEGCLGGGDGGLQARSAGAVVWQAMPRPWTPQLRHMRTCDAACSHAHVSHMSHTCHTHVTHTHTQTLLSTPMQCTWWPTSRPASQTPLPS